MKKDRVFLVVVAIVVLTYGVIYPNASVLISSFQRAGVWSFANYSEVLSQRFAIEAIISSLGLSIGTVLLCALVGVPLAFLFERFTFPGRRLFAAIAALPLVLPPLVGTVAFIFLAGETGILAHSIQNLFRLEHPPWRLVGWPALLLFHTYTMYPFFYVLTGAGLRRIDASLAEAARSLGGSRTFIFTRVLAPQLTPSLIAAALLTFMTSMASFSAPLLFGGNVRVLTLEIFRARQRGDVVMAVTETVILAVISLAALIIFQRYEGTRKFAAATMKGAPRRRVTIASGKTRLLAATAAVVFAIILALPVATLVLVSFARENSWTTQTLPSAYTLANYQRLFSDPYSSEVFFNSFSMSAIAALAALIWSFCVVTLLIKRERSKRTALESGGRRLLSLLILVPCVAGNGCRSFRRGSLRTVELVVRFVCFGRHFLDSAGCLLLAFHAAGRAGAPGQHGAIGSHARGGGWIARRACVATIYPGDVAAGVAGSGRWDPAGVCDRVRRICGFRACICSSESTHFDSDRIRVTRFQSGRCGGVRGRFDRHYFDQRARRG